jgi:multimeric flavodoxin WrbA
MELTELQATMNRHVTREQEAMNQQTRWDFSDLRALFINCTLKRSPEVSNTRGLADISMEIMRRQGVAVDVVRAIDHDIATGVWPDMTEHGWERDDWPAIHELVQAAHILVLCTPIWLGEKSSVCTQVIERLYGNSHLLNEAGQYAYYGRVGGCLVTGNEDGVKHCAMNVLYSLQHLGYVIPPQADAGWIGEAGPGPSYLDPGSGGPRERLHQPEHHLHDLEPAAPRTHDHRRRWHARPRQPTRRVGRRRAIRLPQPRLPLKPVVAGLRTPRARQNCRTGARVPAPDRV